MLALRYMIGFLLQILPCTFFCAYPFMGRLKYSGRKETLVTFSLILFMSIVFSGVGAFSQPRMTYERHALIQNLIFYSTLLLLLIYYCLAIDASFYEKLFQFSIVMNYGFILTTVMNFFFEEAGLDYLYSSSWLLADLISNLVCLAPMVFLVRRVRRAFLLLPGDPFWKLLCPLPLLFLLAVICFVQVPQDIGIPTSDILIVFLFITFAFMFLVFGFLFLMMENASKRSKEIINLQANLNNYRHIAENAEHLREMRHEMRHHMTAIALYLRNEDYHGARQYLEQTLNIIDDLNVKEYSPCPLLNSILTEYKELAKKQEVKITYRIMVPSSVNMEDVDLCRLLTNMLDNALEGCSHVDVQERELCLQIHQEGQFLFFSCENTCQPDLLKTENENFKTIKTSGNHGHGIACMKSIASQYNGAFRAEQKGKKFYTYVNLCLSKER